MMGWKLISDQNGCKLYISDCGAYAKKTCYIFGELRTVKYKLNKWEGVKRK